jgi:hypothetical protein
MAAWRLRDVFVLEQGSRRPIKTQGGGADEKMRRLWIAGFCLAVVLTYAAADASASTPTWFECGKAAKSGKTYLGHYAGKSCEAASQVATGGKYELNEGIGKGKPFKGKGGKSVLHVKTWLGDDTVECKSSKSSASPALPNLETNVVVIYKGCKAFGNRACSSSGRPAGEIEIAGLHGEFGFIEESPQTVVGLKLESEAHPGVDGALTTFSCNGLEVTVTGGLIGVQSRDIDTISKDSQTVYVAGEYIGERRHGASKYKPLVNIVGWADEQEAIAKEVKADEKGEIGKLARPILKALMCGEAIEQTAGEECLSEAYAGQDQTIANKGEALMLRTGFEAGEPVKSLLIGEVVAHENGGDAKKEEITPLKFVAQKTGTVCYETGGYLFPPVETSLILGIQEDAGGGLPGKVLGEGTIAGKLPVNTVACVTGLKVPIAKGKTYFLTFLPLGGTITYWYGKSETVIYSEHHKKLTEGPPEQYEWKEEAEEAPIGMWANGT